MKNKEPWYYPRRTAIWPEVRTGHRGQFLQACAVATNADVYADINDPGVYIDESRFADSLLWLIFPVEQCH